MKFSLAALAVVFAPACAFAQIIEAGSSQMMVGDTMIYPDNPAYPAGLAARGAQGRVLVRVTVDANGGPSSVSVRESSRSRALDRAAVALVRTYRHAPARPGMGPDEVLVPIRFRKDTIPNLRSKTCADLNVDKAWFTATFPEKKVFELDAVSMAMDTLVLSLPGPQQAAYTRNSQAVALAAIAACATRPGDKFFTVMQQEASTLPRK